MVRAIALSRLNYKYLTFVDDDVHASVLSLWRDVHFHESARFGSSPQFLLLMTTLQ